MLNEFDVIRAYADLNIFLHKGGGSGVTRGGGGMGTMARPLCLTNKMPPPACTAGILAIYQK